MLFVLQLGYQNHIVERLNEERGLLDPVLLVGWHIEVVFVVDFAGSVPV